MRVAWRHTLCTTCIQTNQTLRDLRAIAHTSMIHQWGSGAE
uniref:Uncharacterized protein n=1 Tax=Arundo donax TaxID=35708 RepID=A0A0A9BEY4_ARUDO